MVAVAKLKVADEVAACGMVAITELLILCRVEKLMSADVPVFVEFTVVT